MVDKQNTIYVTFVNNLWCKLVTFNRAIYNDLDDTFSATTKGARFTPQFKARKWDGKTHFISRITGRCGVGLLYDVVAYCKTKNYVVEYTNNYTYLKPAVSSITDTFLEGVTLRDYQVDAVNTALQKPVGIIKASTGAGKTECICCIAKAYSNAKKILVVVNKKDLVEQTRDRMLLRGIRDVGVFYGEEHDYIDKKIIICTIQSVVKSRKDDKGKSVFYVAHPYIVANTDVIISDECFDKDTRILLPDNKCMRIEDIYNDNRVTHVMSYNVDKKIYEPTRIMHRFRKENTDGWCTVRVIASNGHKSTLNVTKNHRIWTKNRGYVKVCDLVDTDILKSNTSKPKISSYCEECGKLISNEQMSFHKNRVHNPEYNHTANWRMMIDEAIGKIQKFVCGHDAYINVFDKNKIHKTKSVTYQYNIEVEDNNNYFANDILVSNCKHEGSSSILHIIEHSPATVRYGLDATPFEKGDKLNELMIKKHMGSIIYDLDTKQLVDRNILVRPRINMIEINSNVGDMTVYAQIYAEGIVNNTRRNKVIQYIAGKLTGRILILISHIAHGKILQTLIPNALFLHGTSDDRHQVLHDFNNADNCILIGSTILDEGIDFSNGIHGLIVASAGRSFRRTIQRLGRALRRNDQGYVDVFDFLDKGNKYLHRHARMRKRHYELEGHTVTVGAV
jgi:superfamily II DNA or RNA helicase